jgi:hypothetical protein
MLFETAVVIARCLGVSLDELAGVPPPGTGVRARSDMWPRGHKGKHRPAGAGAEEEATQAEGEEVK